MKISVAFIILFNNILAQEKVVSGRVLNSLEEPLAGVMVSVNSQDESNFTNCKDEFKIFVKVRDTVVLSKEGYLTSEIIIKKIEKHESVMNFDHYKALEKLKKYPNYIKSLTGGGQPLYVINGEIYIPNNSENKSYFSQSLR